MDLREFVCEKEKSTLNYTWLAKQSRCKNNMTKQLHQCAKAALCNNLNGSEHSLNIIKRSTEWIQGKMLQQGYLNWKGQSSQYWHFTGLRNTRVCQIWSHKLCMWALNLFKVSSLVFKIFFFFFCTEMRCLMCHKEELLTCLSCARMEPPSMFW